MNWEEIKTREDFANYIGIPYKYITYLLYSKRIENLYDSFEIPKKSGGVRVIHSPKPELKRVQQRFLKKLEERYAILENSGKVSSKLAHGFIKSKSIITNAKLHRNKHLVLNVDIENFFQSFHFGRVVGFFEKNKNFLVPSEVAILIAQITCYDGSLPQGSPCSPIITNFICQILDFRISKLAKRYNLNYSRYADDMTFSTNDKRFWDRYSDFIFEITRVIDNAGFVINKNKTRVQSNRYRQEVTGLVVNKKVNVLKSFSKNTRAMAYSHYTKGEFWIDGERGTLNQLFGRFNFIDQLEKYNNKIMRDLSLQKNYTEHQKYLLKKCKKGKSKFDYLNNLTSKEKEFRKFLYYYYFFYNSTPVIVTEGKTDNRYIKAALKKYYSDYPCLIQKSEDGKFVFSVKFLKRTSLLNYYFKFSKDGADSMKNLSNFWFGGVDEKSFPNYSKYFQKLTNHIALSPVIFIFDNELKDNKKPIRNFINHISNNSKQDYIKKVRQDNYSNIEDNLYLLTLPSKNEDTEIEDLFDRTVLNHKIQGKKFSKESNYDINQYCGKNEFSNYILRNYKNIDFKNFKPLLNNLNKIIADYRQNDNK
ncbi:retron Ec67 family RNA-directed DNA polymerase/endonuclease [Streptococcus sp. H49]|uniref:retron Ec67 family RNA-directed DNA polymerase/endonuclease n=1 Tax=Streptococcus huangxiaojuni TaxID=3237239 RepID=UPI0034A1E33C